jgi:hypothetical protein
VKELQKFVASLSAEHLVSSCAGVGPREGVGCVERHSLDSKKRVDEVDSTRGARIFEQIAHLGGSRRHVSKLTARPVGDGDATARATAERAERLLGAGLVLASRAGAFLFGGITVLLAETTCRCRVQSYRRSVLPEADYLTTAEIARWRHCSTKKVKRLREEHGLPHDWDGKQFLYPRERCLAWAAQREISHAPVPRPFRGGTNVPVRKTGRLDVASPAGGASAATFLDFSI